MKELDIVAQDERWSTYTMKDGTVLRVKPAIVSISATGDNDPSGLPGLSIKHQLLTDIVSGPRKTN